jgi:hypothetical protein
MDRSLTTDASKIHQQKGGGEVKTMFFFLMLQGNPLHTHVRSQREIQGLCLSLSLLHTDRSRLPPLAFVEEGKAIFLP